MTIKTGRGDDYITYVLDTGQCIRCGLCAKVCQSDVLHFANGAITISHGKTFGCIGCAHCAAVCPNGCIRLKGRTLGDKSLEKLPSAAKPSFDSLYALALSRRSVREYKDKDVPDEFIENILAFTATAPVQVSPSNVELLVLKGREKVRGFAFGVVDSMRRARWMFSKPLRQFLRPFMTKSEYESIETFLLPLMGSLEEKQAKGDDGLTMGAPLAMYFYGVGFADPVDCQVAATYAMIAGEALGIGTRMIGSVAPFIRHSHALKSKYGLPAKHISGVLVAFGYPEVTYNKAIKRQIGAVRYP